MRDRQPSPRAALGGPRATLLARPAPAPTAMTPLWEELLRAWDANDANDANDAKHETRAAIVALGGLAVPELVHHLEDPDEHARHEALVTLAALGRAALPALSAIKRRAVVGAEVECDQAIHAFCTIDLSAALEHSLGSGHRTCSAVVRWIERNVPREKRRRLAAVLLGDHPKDILVALAVFERAPLVAPIEAIVALAQSTDARVRTSAANVLTVARAAAIDEKKTRRRSSRSAG